MATPVATHASGSEDFHRWPGKPPESVCMFCFITVGAYKPELPGNAEDAIGGSAPAGQSLLRLRPFLTSEGDTMPLRLKRGRPVSWPKVPSFCCPYLCHTPPRGRLSYYAAK